MHLSRAPSIKRSALFLDFLAPSILSHPASSTCHAQKVAHASTRASSSRLPPEASEPGWKKVNLGKGVRVYTGEPAWERPSTADGGDVQSMLDGVGFHDKLPAGEGRGSGDELGELASQDAAAHTTSTEPSPPSAKIPPHASTSSPPRPIDPGVSGPNPSRPTDKTNQSAWDRTVLRLALLQPVFTSDFLVRLRRSAGTLAQRDINDISSRLCQAQTGETYKLVQSPPEEIDWQDQVAVEMEVALICSGRGFSHGLRQVMLRHLAADGPYAEAWIERAWKGIVAQKAEDSMGTGLRGHGVSEIVAIYIAMLARRAMRSTGGAGEAGEAILPPNINEPAFVRTLILSLSIVPGVLSKSHCTALLSEYVSPNVLATVHGWLAATSFARTLVQTKKLYYWLTILGQNRRVDDLTALWEQCRDAVEGGWAVFAGSGDPNWAKKPDEESDEEWVDKRLSSGQEAEFGKEEVESFERDDSYEPGLLKPSDLPLHIATIHQSAFLTTFLLLHRAELAFEVLDFLLKHKVKLTTHHCRALLSGFAKVKHGVSEAERFWEFMKAAGVKPDIKTWNAWLQALFHGRKWEQGLTEFGKMQEAFAPPHGNIEAQQRAVGLTTWNNVLNGLFINARHEEGRMVWRQMRNLGLVDITSVNTLLRYLSRKRDWSAIAALVRSLPERNLRPDIYTFTTVLKAVSLVGGNIKEGVKMVWDVMTAQGVRINHVLVTEVMHSLIRTGTEEGLRSALALLDEVEAADDVAPRYDSTEEEPDNADNNSGNLDAKIQLNEVSYTAVIAGVWKSNRLTTPVREELTASLLARMRARGLGENRVTYHVLMKAAFGSNSTARGMELWREMRAKGIAGTLDTWQIVLRGLLAAGRESHGAAEMARRAWIREVGERLEADNFVMPPTLASLWQKANGSLRSQNTASEWL